MLACFVNAFIWLRVLFMDGNQIQVDFLGAIFLFAIVTATLFAAILTWIDTPNSPPKGT